MTTTVRRQLPAAAALLATAGVQFALARQSGYGYGAGTGSQDGAGSVPQGVGYNNPGGEISRQALQQAALAPAYHFHMSGTNASDAVGMGGGPPITEGEQPGYVQAKFVTPYGNATVVHHYGPGYPPPIGTPGAGPNDGNNTNINASGTVAGNPGMVNWGTTAAWTREEIGNGVWFAGAGGQASGSPTPWVGSFND